MARKEGDEAVAVNTEHKKCECPLCSMKPFFYDDRLNGLRWGQYESSETISSGPWTWLKACKDKDNRLALYGVGEDFTEMYYPKFCPECGRKLE